jgi:hypothetical protein
MLKTLHARLSEETSTLSLYVTVGLLKLFSIRERNHPCPVSFVVPIKLSGSIA